MSLNSINLNLSDKIIFDSGGTDHIYYNKYFLTNIDLTNNIKYVLVANGMKVQINGIGNYNIFSREIKNILYVNSFSINLIFIKKLTQAFNYNVIFSSKNIIFQDRTPGKKIGEGFIQNELYILILQVELCALTKINDFKL
jgi:hypothetical protein